MSLHTRRKWAVEKGGGAILVLAEKRSFHKSIDIYGDGLSLWKFDHFLSYIFWLTDQKWPMIMLKINQEKIANKLEFGYAFWMHMPCKKFATILG